MSKSPKFEIVAFDVDSIAGRYTVAVKSEVGFRKDARTDAYTAVINCFGRGARIIGEGRVIKSLRSDFDEVRGCNGWGWMARQQRRAA